MFTENPLYTSTMLDTGIDPREQDGHEKRVQTILRRHPSRLLDTKGNFRPQRRKRTR